ncbi:MAG: efflux RND transporter permease subunit [Lachnospiraceae bacterium]|nr:efflux RND transporter permease subunit [Lachnospiraceae bacterium]
MLSKFSVKKPYTVWVGVIMIIILGVVSVMNMVMDLLPSMNLPYSLVYTTYIGASPEEVEQTVTRPVESAMATVSNIRNIRSVSSENLSMVIMEFEESANMDSATIEMRENLDQISASWGEGIGSPMIMNINPDMLPVMIAAVDLDGLSGPALSEYVNSSLLSRLESVEGVARVSASGGVSEAVEVVIDDEKLASVNEEIRSALSDKFTDARKELQDARDKINEGLDKVRDGEKEISSARNQISSGMSELTDKFYDAKQETDAKQAELAAAKEEAAKQLADLTAQKESLESTRASLIQGLDPEPFAEQIAQIDAALAQTDTGIGMLNSTIEQLDSGLLAIDDARRQIELQESDAAFKLYSALAEASAGSVTLSSTKSQLESSLEQLDSSEETIDDSEQSAYDKADLKNIITRSLIGQILSAQNFAMPAGYISGETDEDIIVRVGNKLSGTDDISQLILMDMDIEGVDPVKLSDVATVTVVDDSDSVYATVNGRPGILLTFEKQTGYSTNEVSQKLQQAFDRLSGEKDGLGFTILMDQGMYINYIVDSVFSNLLWGALFAIIVLALFLRSFKPTLIVAVSIPVSLMAAIAAMYFTGININIISLSGLALAVGMLVDNSIVVIENIYRLRGEGVPLYKACVQGAREVAGAIIASTLTTCCVFLPIVFTEGLTRQLFTDLGLTMTYSLAASLIIALTLVPAMSSGLLRKVPEKKDRFLTWLQNGYKRSILFFLRHKALVLAASLLLLIGSAWAAYRNGTSFMPSMETTQLTVTMTAPDGSTFGEITDLSSKVVDRILTLDDVTTVGAMKGGSGISGMLSAGRGGGDDSSVRMYVLLREDKALRNSEIRREILSMTEDLDCEISVEAEMSDMSAIYGSGVSVKLTGRDLDRMKELATDFAEKLSGVDGLENVRSGVGETTPELRVVVDKDAASAYNLTVAQVYSQIAAKVSASRVSTVLETDTADIDVYVYDGGAREYSRDDIMALELSSTSNDGAALKVRLSDIAAFEDTESLSSISRENQNRTITISASLAEGYNIGQMGSRVQEVIDGFELPAGYELRIAGQNESINEALTQMFIMLGLAIVFVYLVMVAQFQSLRMPFIIMATIPLAFTGGFLGLIICNMDLSVISLLGLIILTGVIVNNGIVLVDYINQLRYAGIGKREAIAEAGRTRLRPILMTAITTILGLVMMALGVGMGADMVQPVAVVTIGGMLYGTLMTLWVVPCIYDIFTGKKELKARDVD